MCLVSSGNLAYVGAMVRKAIWAGIAVLVLQVASAGAAAAAPPATAASSWQSVVENGEIVGGSRTVSITNWTDEVLSGQAIELATVPCDCVVIDEPATGEISGGHWIAPPIEPGQTLEVTFAYAPTDSVQAIGTTLDFNGGILLLALLLGAVIAGATRITGREPVAA